MAGQHSTITAATGTRCFSYQGWGEGLTTSFVFPSYDKCCADPLYLINWIVFFSLTRKHTQICSKTGSSKHWRYESANNAESKLFTKAPILAPLSAILSQVVGNPKVLLPKIIHEMSFIHDKFCPFRQSFVLLNGQFVWKHRKNCECCPGPYLSTSVYYCVVVSTKVY